MMANFGFTKEPTEQFPEGITEPMSRDFYAMLLVICSQHFLSALPMVPVLLTGWEKSSEEMRCCFILGTLSDVGFNLYDSAKATLQFFAPKQIGMTPIPFEYWFIGVVLHHSTSMFLVIPMNLKYAHRWEYHQLAVNLLLAASICYLAGCYKFTIDVLGKKTDFIKYKLIVVLQMGVILYTRVWLWFPSALSLRAHIRDQNDTTFFYGCTVMFTLLSLFNIILVVDGMQAIVKWVPKKFPQSEADKEETRILIQRSPSLGAHALASPAMIAIRRLRAKQKFRAAVHSVIASQRLASSVSKKAQ